MSTIQDLLDEVEQLPTTEKWLLVTHVLRALEHEQRHPPPNSESEWHQFLRETYGSLRDTPIQRWDQGEHEEREPLE
jgi:hypothetical protein